MPPRPKVMTRGFKVGQVLAQSMGGVSSYGTKKLLVRFFN